MVFVNTTLDVAIERNKIRTRNIPEYVVVQSWKGVQGNIGKFQRLFGQQNFIVIDNNKSDKELVTRTLGNCNKIVRRYMRTPIKSYLAKAWVAKEKMLRNKLSESIIDVPRSRYAVGVFDDADTENPKLKPKVIDMIKAGAKHFSKWGPVVSIKLIGSIIGKRYRNDADLDIDVLIDIPEKDRETIGLEARQSVGEVSGKLVPGTQHPVNYYVQTDPKVNDAHLKTATGVFDVLKQKFDKRPKEQAFDPKVYEAEFQKKVAEIDVVKGELKRDIVDYEELKELSPNDILNLQEKINEKLEEIEDAIEKFSVMGDELMQARRDLFNRPLTPEEIKKYGIAHKLPKNVVYKFLEKFHYTEFFKKCKEILEDGKVTDAEIDSLKSEAVAEKSIAFTFGRFNPPTIGHEKLINKVAREDRNYKIYISRSEDSKKNPLSPRDKLSWMKKIFPQYARNIEINTTNMILDIVTRLYKQGYNAIKMVVGSDRVREFDTILKKYNDIKSRHGHYNFKKIDVISAGERDPDAEGASGMSASKMRDAAQKGDIKTFKRGLPSQFRDVEGLFKSIRKGMGIREEYKPDDSKPIMTLGQFEQKQVRDLYVREMIFNIGDQVKYLKEEKQGKVVRRGTNYVVLEDTNNNLHKCWIWDCIPVAADKEPMLREYNLDVDYGFEAVTSIPKPTAPLEKKSYKTFTDSYEIGADYANHCKEMTPLETPNEKPVDAKDRGKPTDKYISHPGKATDAKVGEDTLTKKEVSEWAAQDSVIDKYKQRYKEEWKTKLNKVVAKMIDRI
jgi:predicted nucleotidyltransferase